ncbi:LuxR C-terminal-related transcriptional regulator [Nonomuraea sp. NPDC047897]|uniref:LuxR C-terminal-related transcriptional regulator n=1 Tax=Nonomuraea sp. NPDC047897 TaxID=3364346 RepID=UPI003711398B
MSTKRQSARGIGGSDGVALVALGSELVRCGLATMLRDLGAFREVLDSGDFDHSMELLHSGRPEVLVVSAPVEQDKAEKLARTAADHDVRVLLLLRTACDQTLERVAAMPADGYLLEGELTPETLRSTLTDLDSGLVPVPQPVARRLLAKIRPAFAKTGTAALDGPAPVDGDRAASPLTSREQQTLALMAEGLSNKQIARRLGISEHGAKRHVANILAKLNCSNRTLATAVALRRGLVSPPGRRPR